MKLIIVIVVGLYAWAFAGSWMRAHPDVLPSGLLEEVQTLRDLHALEERQERDYLAWLQGRVPAEVVAADDAQLARYRERLLATMR